MKIKKKRKKKETGEDREGVEAGGRNGPNNVCTYE
jgi:hypothetical protein